MKTFAQVAGIFLIIVLTIVFMANKMTSTTSDTELEAALDQAVEHALYVAMTDNTYSIDDTEKFAADVMVELFATSNTTADFTFKFNHIDIENGLVDFEVTQKVKVNSLIKSDITCRKTVILEESLNASGDDPGEEDVHPPVLAANNSWWTSESDKNAIKAIQLLDKYTGDSSESWPAGEDDNGDGKNDDDVMCYVNGTTLFIAGNGYGKIFANPDSSHVFEDFKAIETIEGLEVFDTSHATSMNSMFKRCYVLSEIDLSNFDTGNVTDMGSMFFHCQIVTSLDTSGFETDGVTDMGGMFSGCYAITSLDLSNFDTSSVIYMDGMFSACHSLSSLSISNFVTTNVTTMHSMFAECKKLTSLNLSNFSTANVTEMSSMFDRCSGLTSLNVTSFDTANVTDMSYMFHACEKLTSLDLSSFDTSKLEEFENTEEMFYWCNSLTSIVARTEADKAKFERVGNSVPYGCTITIKPAA